MAVGLWLLSNLHADTPIPILWAWMFVAGIGIGPTFAVFTLVVQNSVPVARLGTATSNLTFFQQVGGTVGLAVTGTIFASVMRDQVPLQMVAKQVPPEIIQQVLSTVGAALTSVGDLAGTIVQAVPGAEPLIDAIVAGIYEAVSLATANTFLVGIVAAIIAAAVVLLLREAPEAAVVAERDAMAAASAGAMTAAPREATPTSAAPLYTEQVGERPE